MKNKKKICMGFEGYTWTMQKNGIIYMWMQLVGWLENAFA